jgi:hypothetical protein
MKEYLILGSWEGRTNVRVWVSLHYGRMSACIGFIAVAFHFFDGFGRAITRQRQET